jgi:hypothetical protein
MPRTWVLIQLAAALDTKPSGLMSAIERELEKPAPGKPKKARVSLWGDTRWAVELVDSGDRRRHPCTPVSR